MRETDFNYMANTQRCIHVFNHRHCSLCTIQYIELDHKLQANPKTNGYQEARRPGKRDGSHHFFGVTLEFQAGHNSVHGC